MNTYKIFGVLYLSSVLQNIFQVVIEFIKIINCISYWQHALGKEWELWGNRSTFKWKERRKRRKGKEFTESNRILAACNVLLIIIMISVYIVLSHKTVGIMQAKRIEFFHICIIQNYQYIVLQIIHSQPL